MKSIVKKCLLAAAALAAVGTVNAQQPRESIIVTPGAEPVFVNTEGMPTYLAERVEREAQKGLRALNNYVVRTRVIHNLYLPSILVTREEAMLARLEGRRLHLVAIAQDD